MKKSTLILVILISGLFVSMSGVNLSLKSSYDHLDKSNPFWNYRILKAGSFSHVNVLDNSSTRVIFRHSTNGSVGILEELADQHRVEATIVRDTLFIKILQFYDKPGMRNWLAGNNLVCITSPNLKSIRGNNSTIMIKDLDERNFSVALEGKSRVEVESLQPYYDSLYVQLRDSSYIKFEMAEEIPSDGLLAAKSLRADLRGKSFLDVGHFKIESLQQNLGPNASIALSGGTLEVLNKSRK